MTLGCKMEDAANPTYSMDPTSAASNFDIRFRKVTEPTARTISCVVSRRHGRFDLADGLIGWWCKTGSKSGDESICVGQGEKAKICKASKERAKPRKNRKNMFYSLLPALCTLRCCMHCGLRHEAKQEGAMCVVGGVVALPSANTELDGPFYPNVY